MGYSQITPKSKIKSPINTNASDKQPVRNWLPKTPVDCNPTKTAAGDGLNIGGGNPR
jgi:hypothetical protein